MYKNWAIKASASGIAFGASTTAKQRLSRARTADHFCIPPLHWSQNRYSWLPRAISPSPLPICPCESKSYWLKLPSSQLQEGCVQKGSTSVLSLLSLSTATQTYIDQTVCPKNKNKKQIPKKNLEEWIAQPQARSECLNGSAIHLRPN